MIKNSYIEFSSHRTQCKVQRLLVWCLVAKVDSLLTKILFENSKSQIVGCKSVGQGRHHSPPPTSAEDLNKEIFKSLWEMDTGIQTSHQFLARIKRNRKSFTYEKREILSFGGQEISGNVGKYGETQAQICPYSQQTLKV